MVDVDALAGKSLGQYELRTLIGSGGMGAVYRGVQTTLKRNVAVKVLYNRLSNDPEYLERFNREALIAASLEHPHIVPVYDYGTDGQINYVVMRLLTGGSLEQRFGYSKRSDRPLPSVGEVIVVLRQLASALDYAHSKNVVHRDIKDSNVMFDEHGSAFIVDFGIARLTEVTSQLTGTGMTLGTPSFMSPEQWRGEQAQPASDQYSTGVMAFTMLTGQLPFSAPNPHALMYKHLNEEVPDLQAIRPELGPQVKNVFDVVMAKSIYDRFDTVTEFVNRLEAALPDATQAAATLHEHTGFFTTSLPQAPKPTAARNNERQQVRQPQRNNGAAQKTRRKPEKRGFPVTAMVTLLVLLLVIGGAGFSYLQSQQTPPTGLFVALGLVDTTPTAPPPTLAPSDTPTLRPTAIPPTLSPVPQVIASATPLPPTSTATATPTEVPPTPTPTPSAAQLSTVRDNVIVRRGPGPSYPILTQLRRGDSVRISGISEDGAWYQVQTEAGIGWVLDSPSITAAGNLQGVPVALAPTSTQRPSPTPTNTLRPRATNTRTIQPTWTPLPPQPTVQRSTTTPIEIGNCPGALPSRLVPGLQGYVLDNDPRPINIREEPNTSADILGTVPVRASFSVLAGPECGEDIAWYLINYSGRRGWIAEGTEVYFVIPVADATPLPIRVTEQQLELAIAELPACNNLRVSETFSGGTTNEWFTYDQSERYNIQIQDGAYQINMLSIPPVDGEAPVSWGSLQDLRMRSGRVDAIIRTSQFSEVPTSRTGIWLRYQNEENFLAFMIVSTGKYRIARFQEGYTDLVGWRDSSAINIGDNAVNTLSVSTRDNTFRFFINGQLVDTVTDSTWADGRIAFMGSTTDQPATFALEHFQWCNND